MAQLSLWKCDNCGAEYRSGSGGTVKLVTENSATATWSDSVDLCVSCLLAMIRDMATQVNVIMRAEIMQRYIGKRGN